MAAYQVLLSDVKAVVPLAWDAIPAARNIADDGRWTSIYAASRETGLSISTLSRLWRRGVIRAHRDGKRVLVCLHDARRVAAITRALGLGARAHAWRQHGVVHLSLSLLDRVELVRTPEGMLASFDLPASASGNGKQSHDSR